MTNYNPQSGNALWFILLAVALLAALTATISRSSDTAEQSGNIERYRIDASDIMRHTNGIKEAVNAMRLRGLSENRISFENNFTTADYTNANAAGCSDCLLYGSAGGGASYRVPNSTWLDSAQSGNTHYGDWYIPVQVCVPEIGRGGAGCGSDTTNNEELIMVLPWVKAGLCSEINSMLGVTTVGDPPPQVTGDAFVAGYPVFTGSLSGEGGEIIDGADALEGVEAGCFEGNGTPPAGTYHFYQVLIKR